MENEIWLKKSLSAKLAGKDTEVFDKKLEDLKNAATELAPNGLMVVFVSSEKEKFSPIEKLAANLTLMGKIYNERTFMRNPEIANEFAEIASHIKAINNIVDRRKRKRGKKNEKNENN